MQQGRAAVAQERIVLVMFPQAEHFIECQIKVAQQQIPFQSIVVDEYVADVDWPRCVCQPVQINPFLLSVVS
jgi:hypothetical protein